MGEYRTLDGGIPGSNPIDTALKLGQVRLHHVAFLSRDACTAILL